MLLWMTLSLLYCSEAFGRLIHFSTINTLVGNQIPCAFGFTTTPDIRLKLLRSSSTRLFARGSSQKMRGVKKENLPSKVCVVCNRPFTWRKKWERCWDEVTTCSKSCNSKRRGRKSEYASDSVKEDDGNNQRCDEIVINDIKKVDVERNQVSSILAANFANVVINRDTTGDCLQNTELEEIFADIDMSGSNLDVTDSDAHLVSSDNSQENNSDDPYECYPCGDSKSRRKAEKKRMKAERRAQREGRGDPSAGQKQCTMCNKSVNLLIRCTYDSTEEWGMVCGKCWNDVSGGVVDGDAAHPYYRYGGLWKNRRAQKS